MAGSEKLYFARRSFEYGAHGELDRGQVVTLTGAPNDEKLTRLGYLMQCDTRITPAECGECGARFVGDAERAGHGSKRHSGRVLTPEEEDERLAREERRLENEAPLFIENSKASKAAGGGRRVRVPD